MTAHPGNLAGKPPAGLKQSSGLKVRKPLKAKPKTKTREARAHLAAVKALPCVICGRPGPSDAHHVYCGRFSQAKASDFEVIPLCKAHHQDGPEAIHQNKRLWVETHGPDTEVLELRAAQSGAIKHLNAAMVGLEFMAAEDDEAGQMARHPQKSVLAALASLGGAANEGRATADMKGG